MTVSIASAIQAKLVSEGFDVIGVAVDPIRVDMPAYNTVLDLQDQLINYPRSSPDDTPQGFLDLVAAVEAAEASCVASVTAARARALELFNDQEATLAWYGAQ